ncbi:MAG: 50S ribosomal protein L25 [Rhodothermales bacterium]|nr:50S ribosomal protein L25 [Rhodothermales bacterium]
MDVIKLDAKPRTPGKGPARAARRNEEVPCILYGHTMDASVPFQVGELDMRPLIYTAEFHRVEVSVGGESYDCILKHVDFHPVSDRPIHADFQLLTAGEKITLTVPLQIVGTSLGQRNGGSPVARVNELSVTCLPKDIPDHFQIDVTDIDVGDAVHLESIADEKYEFDLPLEATLFFVQAAREEEEEVLEEGMESVAEAGEESPEDGEGESESED